MMKNQLPFNALSMGYILVPKHLLRMHLECSTAPLSELEAWLTILVSVNYEDSVCTIENLSIECTRGESLYSLAHWADRFRWSRGKVRYHLRKWQREKLILLLPNPLTTHLRVLNYEQWTGNQASAKNAIETKMNKTFLLFWNTYHEITQTDRVNIARARKEWKKLSEPERELAIQHIETYYEHLRHVKFCMQASNYLSNKAFLNEYEQ